MNKSGPNYSKLALLLVRNNKVMFLLSFIASIVGFTFLFTITSLSGTIVQTRQDTVVNKYGKFLMVMSDINRNQIEDVKQENTDFDFCEYKVEGNIEYNKNKITMGSMKEQLGEKLGFQLLEGKWPANENEIVIEEYVKSMLEIENQELPLAVTFMKDGKAATYQITGIISNYSSELSVCSDSTLDTKVYPSIIARNEELQTGKTSLVITQKTLNLKSSEDDIYSILNKCQEITPEIQNISINEKLYAYGYENNKDMITTKRIYQVLVNVLLVLEQLVIMRFILNKNKKTLYLFEALGLSKEQRKRVMLRLTVALMISALIISYLLTNVIGFLYMKKTFSGYLNHYSTMVRENFIFECMIVSVIVIAFCIGFGKVKRKSIISEMTKVGVKEGKGYKFKRIDICTIFMQVICLFFMMASMNFMAMFNFEQKDFEYHLYSKQSVVSLPAKEYNIAEYKDRYFSFDAVSALKGYEDYVSLSMTGDTKLSSILLDKDSKDGYFRASSVQSEEDTLVTEIPKEAEQYKVISERYLEITVLPKEEFHRFMSDNGIVNQALENEEGNSCIVIAPNYNTSESKASIKEKDYIELGRIQYNKDQLEFETGKFKVEELLMPKDSEATNGKIYIVMSETVARQSDFIVGYNKIIVNMLEETPVSIQKEIEQKVSLLMASTEGGMLDSTVEAAKEDRLMRGYTSMLCNTILFFCTLSIFIYVLFSSFIDWEKHKHDYGVLRSFGMSYGTLQNNLFVKHGNSIIIAGFIAIFFGKRAFPNGMLTTPQMVVSFVIITIITYLCRVLIYQWNKKTSISSMINDSE